MRLLGLFRERISGEKQEVSFGRLIDNLARAMSVVRFYV